MDVVLGAREFLTPVRAAWLPFGLSIAERRQHVLLLGKTGVGKSTLLRNMVIQDIQAGRGCLFVDPHGDEAERLLDFIPPWRTADVIYLDPTDLSHPIGFNLLEREPAEDRALVASNIVSIFRHFWADSWGARSEYLLLCSVLAILDYPVGQGDVSLLSVQRLLSDADYRARVVASCRNSAALTFWTQEFPTWTPQFAAQALSHFLLTPHPAASMVQDAIRSGVEFNERAFTDILRDPPLSKVGRDVRNEQAAKLAAMARMSNAELRRKEAELRRRVEEEAKYQAAHSDLMDAMVEQQLAKARADAYAKAEEFWRSRRKT